MVFTIELKKYLKMAYYKEHFNFFLNSKVRVTTRPNRFKTSFRLDMSTKYKEIYYLITREQVPSSFHFQKRLISEKTLKIKLDWVCSIFSFISQLIFCFDFGEKRREIWIDLNKIFLMAKRYCYSSYIFRITRVRYKVPIM